MKFLTTITISFCLIFSSALFAALKLNTTITGVKGDALTNAQKSAQHFIDLHEHMDSESDIRRVYRQLSEEIKKSLAPYGYFHPDITSSLRFVKSNWVARYHITPGPRVRISSVSIQIVGEGKYDAELRQWRKKVMLKPGAPLITPKYTKTKDSLLDLAASRGYFDAKIIDSGIRVNPETNRASITIHADTGRRYRFGEVKFEQVNKGAKRLSYRFLSRYVDFKAGEFFNQNQLFHLQEQLRLSHYFDRVSIKPHPELQKNYHVPITVILYASKSKKYQFGLGVGTDTGLRGITGVTYRRLTSDGHYADLNAKGSYKDTNLLGKASISYNIPGHNPSKDLWKFSAQVEQDQGDDFGISTNSKVAGSYITELYGWQQSLSLAYQLENSRPVDEDSFSSNLLIPSVNWLRIRSDDPIKPNHGYRVSANFRGSSKSLLSDTSFVQGQLHAKGITTFGRSTRVIARGDLGMIGMEDIDELPLSLRFTAGGTQTVRGYGFRDIKDGRMMSIASLELQQRIYKDIYGAVFADAGDIGPSFFSDIKHSVGLGLVWRSPIGAVELTIARALDKPGKPSRVELSIGPEL